MYCIKPCSAPGVRPIPSRSASSLVTCLARLQTMRADSLAKNTLNRPASQLVGAPDAKSGSNHIWSGREWIAGKRCYKRVGRPDPVEPDLEYFNRYMNVTLKCPGRPGGKLRKP